MKPDDSKPNTLPSGPPLFSGPPAPPPPARPSRPASSSSVPIRKIGADAPAASSGGKSDIQLEKPGEITIHTMRDDLSRARHTDSPSLQKPAVPVSRPLVSTAPLPKKTETTQAKDITSLPRQVQKKEEAIPKGGSSAKVIAVMVVILIIVSAGGAGVWWWLSGAPQQATPASSPVELATPPEVIPANASLLVRYSLREDKARLDLQEAWAEKSGQVPTVAGLVAGNPTLLLADTALDEFFYVVLKDEPRPYLVAPKTDNTTSLFSQSSVVQVLDLGRWYVVHPLSTDRYAAALNVESLAAAGGLPELPDPFTLQWIVDSEFVKGVHSDIDRAGSILPGGEQIVLSSRLDGPSQTLLFTSNASGAFTAASQAVALDAVSSLVPGDASFIRVGGNFAADLPRWVTSSAISLDATVLEAPAIQQFMQNFSAPYAYYRRQGEDGIEDIGFIIALPEALKKSLSLPHETIETALRALLPAIVGRAGIASVAFTDNAHAGIPLRFTNIVGNIQALDYAVTDDYVLISSSKEGMFTLLETVTNVAPSIAASAPWQAIVNTRNTSLTGEEIVLTAITYPPITKLLPSAREVVYLGLSTRPFGDSREIQGTIFFGETP